MILYPYFIVDGGCWGEDIKNQRDRHSSWRKAKHCQSWMLNSLNRFIWLSSILNCTTSFLTNFSTSCQNFSLLCLSLQHLDPDKLLVLWLFDPCFCSQLFLNIKSSFEMFCFKECLPSMPSCQEFTSASIYHSSEFTQWRRITVLLPQKTW